MEKQGGTIEREGELSTCQATIPAARIYTRQDGNPSILFNDVIDFIKESLYAIDKVDKRRKTTSASKNSDNSPFRLTLIKT